MKSVKRLYYHVMRFRGEILYGSIFATIFLLFFGLFYPEDSIGDMVDVMQSIGIFGNLTKTSAGWGIWVSIMVGLMLYLLIAIVSINIGAKVIPTKDTLGVEFFMGSNPMDPRRFYLENILAGMLAVVLILLPSYLVILLQTWYFNGMEVLGGITMTFSTFLVLAFFFIAATSAVTTFLFQTGKAKAIGFIYVFYGFIMEILADNPDLEETSKLSVNAYTKISTLVTAVDYDWDPILVVSSLSVLFVILGILRIKTPHYLEEATSREGFNIIDATIGRVVAPTSFAGRNFPLVTEQLRRDKTAIFVVFLIYIIWPLAFWNTLSTAGDQLGSLMAGFDTPTTRALAQGHELDQTLIGFSVMKFFSNHWMFFGIYGMLVAASIPTREVNTNSQDIIYGTSVKPTNLMDRRVIAMLIEITFLYGIAFSVIASVNQSLGQDFLNEFVGTKILFSFFLLAWIHYSALFVFITAVAMIPQEVSTGRKWGIIAFVITLLLNIIPHLNENIEFLKYLSLLNYFRPVEIIYGEMGLLQGLIQSGLTLIVCIAFYLVVKKRRYENSSLY